MGIEEPALVLACALLTLLSGCLWLLAWYQDRPIPAAPSPPEPPAEWLRGLYDDLR